MADVLRNDVLVVAVLAWLLAQLSKLLIVLLRERQLQLGYLTSAGGMPSSHSAVVVALATRIGIEAGLGSIAFALAVIFAGVVLYDAAGVRRAVSVQARILNRMLEEVFEYQRFNEKRLLELLGHTPFEVFVGSLLGLLVALSW
ncbi:MAG TPA: divergent PAP2 family protein [Chloroflexota bacterium]|nr:divergent PAP2 family protein [Chloroflexota bacterium]